MKEIHTRSGRVIQSPYDNDQEALDVLTKLTKEHKLNDNFSLSLVKMSKGHWYTLSEERMKWVHVQVFDYEEAQKQQAIQQKLNFDQPPMSVQLDNFSGIIDMFVKASQYLERPRIRLQYEKNGELRPIVLTIARGFSGWVEVYPDVPTRSKKLGSIRHDGLWLANPQLPPNPELTEYLKKFAANPVEYAQIYARSTHRCCFCGLELTDLRSVTVGYGPICAEHYGLPWGQEVVDIHEKANQLLKTMEALMKQQQENNHERNDTESGV